MGQKKRSRGGTLINSYALGDTGHIKAGQALDLNDLDDGVVGGASDLKIVVIKVGNLGPTQFVRQSDIEFLVVERDLALATDVAQPFAVV